MKVFLPMHFITNVFVYIFVNGANNFKHRSNIGFNIGCVRNVLKNGERFAQNCLLSVLKKSANINLYKWLNISHLYLLYIVYSLLYS